MLFPYIKFKYQERRPEPTIADCVGTVFMLDIEILPVHTIENGKD